MGPAGPKGFWQAASKTRAENQNFVPDRGIMVESGQGKRSRGFCFWKFLCDLPAALSGSAVDGDNEFKIGTVGSEGRL